MPPGSWSGERNGAEPGVPSAWRCSLAWGCGGLPSCSHDDSPSLPSQPQSLAHPEPPAWVLQGPSLRSHTCEPAPRHPSVAWLPLQSCGCTVGQGGNPERDPQGAGEGFLNQGPL